MSVVYYTHWKTDVEDRCETSYVYISNRYLLKLFTRYIAVMMMMMIQ